MTDLRALIAGLCAGLDSDVALSFPVFPGAFPGKEARQTVDNNSISRIVRISRSTNGTTASDQPDNPEYGVDAAAASRVTSSYVGEPGKPGNPGKDEKSLAETTPPPFPVKVFEPGKPGSRNAVADVFPLSGLPLPISPSDVHAGVARELRALAEDGRDGPEALRDAVAITAAKIRNSEALAERQMHDGRCHVCDGSLDDTLPVVSVMTGKRGSHLHMHAGCLDAYSAHRCAMVDRIMTAAGYASAQTLEP